jgi:hypothetical protein
MATSECKTITTPDITIIRKTECIGNSLPALNNNFLNLQNALCQVDTNLNSTNITLTQVQNIATSFSGQQLAKAWVNFSGRRREDSENPLTGRTDFTNANRFRRSSYNIANIVRNDIGDYTAFYISPLPENTIVTGFVSMAPTSTTVYNFTDYCVVTFNPAESPDGTKVRIKTVNLQGFARDPEFISLVVYG